MVIKAILIFLNMVFFEAIYSQNANAESQEACAIWLCLPGGFPQGCSGAYNEFKHRIKKGRDPLPRLSSCTTDGTEGSYSLGYEDFEPCKLGFSLKIYGASGYGYYNRSTNLKGSCYLNRCASRISRAIPNDYRCSNYPALKRTKPSFVKMWVEGKYIGKFFY